MVNEWLQSFTGGLVNDRSTFLKYVGMMSFAGLGVFFVVFWGAYFTIGVHYERYTVAGNAMTTSFGAWFLGADGGATSTATLLVAACDGTPNCAAMTATANSVEEASTFFDMLTAAVENQMASHFSTNLAAEYATAVSSVEVDELIAVRDWKLRTPDGGPLYWILYEVVYILFFQAGVAIALAKIVSFACEDQDKAYKLGALVGLLAVAGVRVWDMLTVQDKKPYWLDDGYANWKPEECAAGGVNAIDRDTWEVGSLKDANGADAGDTAAFRNWYASDEALDHRRLIETLFLVAVLLAAPFINILKDGPAGVKGFIQRGMDNNLLNCFVFTLGSLFLVFLMIAETYAVDTFGTMWADNWVRFLVTAAWAGSCLLFASPNNDGVSLNPNMLALVVFYIALPTYAWTMFRWTDECMINVLFHMAALGGVGRAVAKITAENALAAGDSESATEAAGVSQAPVLFLEAFMVFLEMYYVGDVADEQVWMSIAIFSGYQIVRDLFVPFGRLTTELQKWTGGLLLRKSAAVVPETAAYGGSGDEASNARMQSAHIIYGAVIMSGAMIWALTLSEKLFYSVLFEPLVDSAGFDRAIEDSTNAALQTAAQVYGAAALTNIPNGITTNNAVNSPCGAYDKWNFGKSFKVSFRESLRADYANGEAGLTDDQFTLGMLVGAAQIVVGWFLMYATQRKAEGAALDIGMQWDAEHAAMGSLGSRYGLMYCLLVIYLVYSAWDSYQRQVDFAYTPSYTVGCWAKVDDALLTYETRTCGAV